MSVILSWEWGSIMYRREVEFCSKWPHILKKLKSCLPLLGFCHDILSAVSCDLDEQKTHVSHMNYVHRACITNDEISCTVYYAQILYSM